MGRFPKRLLKFPPQVLHFVGIPIFFILWQLIYKSQPVTDFLTKGTGLYHISNMFSFNLIIVSTILLVVLVLSRVLFFILRRVIKPSASRYLMWCVFEVLVCCFFVALYITLISQDNDYFENLLRSVLYMFSVLVYPYLGLYAVYTIHDYDAREDADDGARVKFYDSRHILKFITLSSSLLYIRAAENYLDIFYLDNGVVKKYQLRNSMKSIEALCSKYGLVRAHRSYYVNPSHITMLKKDSNGMFFADLDSGATEQIPVSKKYYSVLSSVL